MIASASDPKRTSRHTLGVTIAGVTKRDVKRKKIGRNERCPCGSDKKYKHCHGSVTARLGAGVEAQLKVESSRLSSLSEAMEIQRTKQQGLGRPIISAQMGDTRFVAIKNRLLHSKKWKTFIDFLGDYIKTALGGDDWGNKEIRNKPLEKRHPILQWYDKVCHHQRKYIKAPGEIYESPKIGAIAAYYGLAYDLYCLDHNAELQKKLVERLKNNDNFYGARYEVAVAAILIRAGFTIEFEDENKRGSTHCEFTATSRRTGRKFSVECKRRESGSKNGELKLSKLGRTLRAALLKNANFERIVFIDLNFPYDPKKHDRFPPHMELALHHIRKFEMNRANAGDLPPSFLFLTNNPVHHHLDDVNVGYAVITDGFKIPEYKTDQPYPLHDAIVNREKHKDIHHLLKSMERYAEIPATFDGQIPEFAFGAAQQRLLVGRHYMVKDGEGHDRVGLMTSATVNEAERKAYCALALETGESAIYTWPLLDAEMAAYKSHPDTFFGEISRNSKAETPLELYDFFLRSYEKTPKEKMLEFFAGRPDIEDLRKLSQPELASMYAEHCVSFALARESIAAQERPGHQLSEPQPSPANGDKGR